MRTTSSAPHSLHGCPRFDSLVDSTGNPRNHEFHEARRRRDEIVTQNASRTFHLLSELQQELQIIIWKHAINVAARYAQGHEVSGCDELLFPILPSQYADDIRGGASIHPTFNSLLWVCRLSRQVSLERWKKSVQDELSTPLQRGGLEPGGPRELRQREILEDLIKELERLKN